MRGYMMTCEERQDLGAETAAALGATDWGAAPTIVVDRSPARRKLQRIVDTGLALLGRAVDEADDDHDPFLIVEDDVDFNAAIRHNLAHWGPIVERRPDGHLFGSVYNPGVILPVTDGRTATVVDPRQFYGSQGIVMSVTTARALIGAWDDADGPLDLRISRLAARWSPLWYHHPSLVQHRSVASTWGGVTHTAVDFSPDWRA